MPLLFLCLLLPMGLSAQPSHGYVAAGLGSNESKTTNQFALGGEWVVGKGVGVGGELGGLVGDRDSFAFASANGYYHFPFSTAERKLDPFVTAGVGSTLDPFEGSAALVNFGGGVNYWFHRRLGVRFEMRDIVAPNHRFSSRHFWGFRVGLSFH
jgi:hypothetical protein